ncbi:MAG TPA: lytic transglycosylase domain-containing protein [Pseudobdellovibrionaceae bacterium]
MRFIILLIIFMSSACATKIRQPNAVDAPANSLELEQALLQGAAPTLAFLKTQTSLKSFEGLNSRDPAIYIPKTLKAEKSFPISKEKNLQQHFLRRFRGWNLKQKIKREHELLADFNCGKAVETQALGFSFELDFPEAEASAGSRALHEQVLSCATFPRQESLFRLAVFSIHGGECPQAMKYLDMFPATPERGVSDRISYLRSLCSTFPIAKNGNPWGGYGSLLGDIKGGEEPSSPKPKWYLSTSSGSEEWDRLLVSFIELSEKNEGATVQYISSKLNFEKFRSLPLAFQTSMLVMMSFNGADLSVFQTLHRYLSDHPETISPAVAGLLFPIRYWKEIIANSKSADPILVKALIRQESAFNPTARSRAKAAGLMQLIYPTAKFFGITQPKQLLAPEANIHAGSEFLSQLINQFGSVELALAAYNAGPATVRDWQRRYPTNNIDLFVEMIPYSETREYVRLVRRNYKVYQSILMKTQYIGDLSSVGTE